MNAIDLLKDDHREVERLLSDFLASEDSETEKREEIFQQIEKELLVHGDIEEQVFYPAVEDLARDKVEEALREHAELRRLLADMLEIQLEDESFDHKITNLMEKVQHHVQEEEAPDGLLELARKNFDEARLQQLAKRMLDLKQQSQEELAA